MTWGLAARHAFQESLEGSACGCASDGFTWGYGVVLEDPRSRHPLRAFHLVPVVAEVGEVHARRTEVAYGPDLCWGVWRSRSSGCDLSDRLWRLALAVRASRGGSVSVALEESFGRAREIVARPRTAGIHQGRRAGGSSRWVEFAGF